MGTAVSGFGSVPMRFVPLIDDHETESVEQYTPKCGIQLVRMTSGNQADFACKVEVEERDLAVPAAPGRVWDDGTRNFSLEWVPSVDRCQSGIT